MRLEIRASYLLVGTVVLALIMGLAAFATWLVRADVNQVTQTYEIAFEGSVTGLQAGSQVQYRGVPVGRVSDIRINPESHEEILVTVELEARTPVKQDTLATLEMLGVTGIAFVQLRGGTQASAPLEPVPGGPPPRIESRRSAIERVFESTPELLARGLEILENLSQLVDPENMQALSHTLQNLETFTGALAAHSDDVSTLVESAGRAAREVEDLSQRLSRLTGDLQELTGHLDQQVTGVGDDLVTTLTELRGAASGLAGAARQLEGMVGDLRQPLDDFSGTGLYEFSQLIGETRQLIASLSRITTEFERDPTGYLLGTGQRGFEAR